MEISNYEIQQIASELKLKKEDFFELYRGGRFFLNYKKFSEVFLDLMEGVIKDVWSSESDLYIINIGREGSGKSLFSIWASYHLSKRLGVDFSMDNIALTHSEWVALQDELERQFLIHDEAVETFSALEFQSSKGRSAMEIAVRNRVKQIINILNIPSLKYVHPYIREERLDSVWINMTLDLKDEKGLTKRYYLKFLLDKENALKLVDILNKKHSLNKYEFIGRKRDGSKAFKFAVGGIFWIDIKNDESMDIVEEYKVKKKTIANITNSENLIKDVIKQNLYYLIEKYRGSYSYYILALLSLVRKWTIQSFKMLDLRYLKDSLALKLFLDFENPDENFLTDGKKKKKEDKDIKWFWMPKLVLDEFIDSRLFYSFVKQITEDLKFRKVKNMSGLFYKIDLSIVYLLGNNQVLTQTITWDDLNWIDRFITASFYVKYFLNKKYTTTELFKFIKEVDKDKNKQNEMLKVINLLKDINMFLEKAIDIIKKEDGNESVLNIMRKLYDSFEQLTDKYPKNLRESKLLKTFKIMVSWKSI